MQFDRSQRVLWLGQVRSVAYRERIELAAKNGYGWMSTSPADYDRTKATGLSDGDIRNIASHNSVRLSYLDPLTSWVPNGLPNEGDENLITYINRSQDEFFRIAEALQVDRIHLIGSFPEGRYTLDELIEHYAKTCERAAGYGMKCLIEAMPLWGLRRFDDVLQIVKSAGQKNSGIVFDTWHYTRAGRNDAILQEIPAGMIDTVQIVDGSKECPAGLTNIEDCVSNRVPIGEGEIANLEILELLNRGGHVTSVGPEIFSAELDKLPGNEIMARIQPGFNDILEQLDS